jgi:hypothetical protein
MKTGWLLIAICHILLGCQRDGSTPETAPAPADLQHCRDDGDCILVDISCNGCCDQDAVNRKDSAEYFDHKSRTCAGYSGPVCDCCFFKRKAVCTGGRCESLLLEQSCGHPLD